MTLGDALSKQVGPLPVGAWGAVVAGGLLIGRYARQHSAGSAPVVDSQATDTGFGTVPTVGNLGGLGTTVGQGSTATSPLIDTNEKWRQVAITNLLGRGYAPALVDTAISKYFAGEPLTQQEQAVIEAAYLYVGPTPQIVPPAATVPTSTTPTPTPVTSPTTTAVPLPSLIPGQWPFSLPADQITQIGTGGPGGFYTGHNVVPGTPEYALIAGQWVQNFNWDTLAPNTPIGIPTQLAAYIYPEVVTYDVTR